MTERMHSDFIPDSDAEEVMESIAQTLARLEAYTAKVRGALHSVNGWLGAHEMTFGEFMTLRDIDTFLGHAELILEDAASITSDVIR